VTILTGWWRHRTLTLPRRYDCVPWSDFGSTTSTEHQQQQHRRRRHCHLIFVYNHQNHQFLPSVTSALCLCRASALLCQTKRRIFLLNLFLAIDRPEKKWSQKYSQWLRKFLKVICIARTYMGSDTIFLLTYLLSSCHDMCSRLGLGLDTDVTWLQQHSVGRFGGL